MTWTLLGLSLGEAVAAGTLEVEADRPLLFYVDGKLASPTGLRSARVTPVEAGTHRLRLAAVGGRTLAEADVDVPDGVVTRVEWHDGQFTLAPAEVPVVAAAWTEPAEAALAVAVPTEAPLEPDEAAPVQVTIPAGAELVLDVQGQRIVVSARDGGAQVRGEAGSGVWFGPDGPHLSATLAVRSRGTPVVITVDGVMEAVLAQGSFDAEIDVAPGTHLVELLDPDDGTVRDRGLVDLEPGEIMSLETGAGAPPPRWRPL